MINAVAQLSIHYITAFFHPYHVCLKCIYFFASAENTIFRKLIDLTWLYFGKNKIFGAASLFYKYAHFGIGWHSGNLLSAVSR